MNKLLVILGSTATGKTDLGLYLAKKFNGELVSCDSRQVYTGLDIGTGKMPNLESRIMNHESRIKKQKNYWEIDGIKIWMYDVVEPSIQYSVYDYIKDSEKVIEDIIKRGKLPIIVGGTGLYLKGLLEGFFNMSIPVDIKFREVLEKLDKQKLQKKLQGLSKEKWESLNYSDQNNPRRLVRAIELSVSQGKGESLPAGKAGVKGKVNNFIILKIGLTAPKEVLYERVDKSVIKRIGAGMVEEAKSLHQAGLSLDRMRKLGLEYGVLADYLEKKITSSKDLIKILQNKIHQFVRRQLTWFKKEKDVQWFDISSEDYVEKLEKSVSKWYYNSINI